MTEKQFCKDCKYVKGIGYDFWCGEGHTEYEVFIGETHCPYYEYHDWSKGTPNQIRSYIRMTEKRFLLKHFEDTDWAYDRDKLIYTKEMVDLLNKYDKGNEQLKSENEYLRCIIEDYKSNEECDKEFINNLHDYNQKLKKENEQLKSQLYCDDEEGVCNICKHHYLIKDDEVELGYYNSRCKKGHYECARVSLKYCEDFEKELKE